jgi:phytoene synthase
MADTRPDARYKGKSTMTLHFSSWEQTLLLRATETENPAVTTGGGAHHDTPHLEEAWALCEAITARHSRSFFIASGMLPPEKRRATRALYAFCRVTDDLVDDPQEEITTALARWRRQVTEKGLSAEHPVAAAWDATRHHYRIPSAYTDQLFDGVARDLEQSRYDSFDDLAQYAYGVASTVGLMSMHIIGFSDPAAIPYAIKLGVALQLTNILRDVGADWQMGRVYLPRDEMEAWGIDEAYIAQGRVDDRWRRFMQFQIARNRRLYAEAWPGIALLNRDGRLAIAAAADLYCAILADIEWHDYDVFNRRAFVSSFGKLRRLARLWLVRQGVLEW